ncbi:MAG: leucine-rich repeat domain-containing protein [Clostridia bacterium]|nr:leucine-rich repeat domain-containing protein [Clostridia bacterium]
MVKLRHSHRTLRIVLCSILGAIVAAGGTFAIIVFSRSTQPNEVPNALENTKLSPEGVTPSEAAADEELSANTLYYLAYVLDTQNYYSAEATNVSSSFGIKSYTHTYKDYSDGVMIATDVTTGVTTSASQTCYKVNDDGELIAYRRTGEATSASVTVNDVKWDDVYSDTYYYYRSDYLYIYGEFSTEMTVYLLNEDTLSEISDIIDNGDGTYSQTFVLGSSASYYYQYAMYTNGGLGDLPSFNSIEMTVTFNENWQVLEVYVEEETSVVMFNATFDTSATTTTTFSYGASSINQENFAYYQSYYVSAIPNATAGGSSAATGDTDVLTLLQSAFSDVLSGGDQYAVILNAGDNTYYGLIYLSVDIATVTSDPINAIEARVLLSSDQNYDTQDLYIEFSDGEISAYYSSDFALKANISEISDIIGDISDWIDAYSIKSSSAATAKYALSAASAAEDSFSLESLLGSLATTDNGDGTLSVSLPLDISGISLYVQLDFGVTETDSGKTYSFNKGYIGDISYNGEDIGLSLTLTNTDAATISRDSSQTAYDLSLAAQSIYELLQSELVELDLAIDGEKLYTLVNSLTDGSYSDYLSIIKELDVNLTALADVDGVTVGAGLEILQGTDTLIDIDVYYSYSGKNYGTAYVTVTEFMGAQTDFNIYCDVKDLADSISGLITAIEGYTQTELQANTTASYSLTAEGGTEESLSLVSIINTVLGMDFNSLITEVKANDYLLEVELDADYLLQALGIDIGADLGGIALGYSYSVNSEGKGQGGKLTLGLDELGISAKAYGTSGNITKPDSLTVYLDLTAFSQSLTKAISGNSIALDLGLSGYSTGTSLDGYTVELSAYVEPSSDSVALYADFAVVMDATQTEPEATVLAFGVYYAYDGTTQSYGKVYLNLTNILGIDCSIKLYCDIDEVVANITDLIAAINEYGSDGDSSSGNGSSVDTEAIIQVVAELLGDKDGFISGVASAVTDIINNGINVNSLVSGLIENIDSIITYIGANNSQAVVTVDTDVLLSVISSSLSNSLSLNGLTITYSLDCDEEDGVTGGGCLSVNWDNCLTADIYGSTVTVASREPTDSSAYIDLNYLVTTVQSAYEVAMDIAEKGAYFTIDGTAEINDIAVSASGKGEVSLDANGNVSTVAVDVTLSVTDGTSGTNNKQTLAVQFVYIAANYNSAATDPFMYIVINGEGMAVTYADYNSFVSQIDGIISIIEGLIGSDDSESNTNNVQAASLTAVSAESSGLLTILKSVLSTLTDRDTISNLNSLSGTLNNFSLAVTNGNVSIKYNNGEENLFNVLTATVSEADSSMSLTTEIMDISAYVQACGTDSFATTLVTDFADTENYNLTLNLDGMINKVYGYIFDYLDAADISALFGSSASALEFTLDGDSSGIDELKGIYVYAKATTGTISGGSSIYSIEADIDISGFTVKASIVYYGDYVYVEIADIGGTEFEDLKLKASSGDIYSLIDNVVNIIMNEKVLSLVESIAGQSDDGTDNTQNANQAVSLAALTLTEEQQQETTSALTSVFTLLNSVIGGIVYVSETNDGYTAIVDIDEILSVFGISGNVGELTANVLTGTSGNITGIEAAIEADSSVGNWLYLYVGAASNAAYTKVDSTTTTGSTSTTLYTESYADIGFTSQLITDIANFAISGIQTENEKVTGVEYTFTGSISVPLSVSYSGINISGTVNISNIELTIGYTADGEFYFDMFGLIEGSSVTVLSIINVTIAQENYIGISYSSKAAQSGDDDLGLITLARGLNADGTASDDTIYWIMTLDYFIDNLFAENSGSSDSPIRWLLQMGSYLGIDLWNIVVDAAGLSLSSGLADPGTLYMYTTTSNSDSSAISIFESYISYFAAIFNGSSYTMGDSSDGSTMVSTLGLDNYENGYYALSLGDGLLGSTFSPIYAALTRSGDSNGLGHILAYLDIAGYLSVSVDLEYKGSSPDYNRNYFDIATDSLTIDWVNGGSDPEETNGFYYYYKFGSVHIAADGTLTYSDSYCLVDDYVIVTVYEWDSKNGMYVEGATYKLRYGSTIYLYSSDSIVTSGDTNYAVVYTTDTYINPITGSFVCDSETNEPLYSDGDLPTSITVTGDISLYEYTTTTEVRTLTFNMIDGTGEIIKTVEYHVFDGGDLPDMSSIYSGYTLLGDTWYTDSGLSDALTETTVSGDMALYGKVAKTSVTVNGVVYTFTNSSTYTINSSNSSNTEFTGTTISVEGGYYSITGYTNLSNYNNSNNWLILEDEIDGYKVLEIQKEVFNKTSIVNVVVPENIQYIGVNAFSNNTYLANVVFLADTVYFDNSGSSVKEYAFCNCSNTLNIYISEYVGLGQSSSSTYYYAFAVNASSGDEAATSARRAKAYVNTDSETTWLYFKIGELDHAGEYTPDDIVSDMIDYLYGSGYCDVYLYAATQYMLINLTANSLDQETLASNLSAYLEQAVNEYTAKFGYINAYEVTATITGANISVSVEERATSEYYYRVDIANYLGSDKDASTTYTVNYSGDYLEFGEDLYFKSGATITVSSGSYGYTLESISYNGEANSSLTLTATKGGTSKLSLYWVENAAQSGIKVISAIPFYYSGNTGYTLNADTEYTIETTSLADATATQSGYYFLGWAYVSGGDLVFTTTPSYTTVTYYAIWAYSSEEITDYTVTDGSNALSPSVTLGTTSTGASFYKWYKDGDFSAEATEISTSQTIVYARMQYILYYYFAGYTSSKKAFVDDNGQTSSFYGKLLEKNGTYYIYEGSYIYMYASTYISNSKEATGYTIDIYDSYSAYENGETYYQRHSLYIFGTNWLGSVSSAYSVSFLFDWDYTDYTSATDSDGHKIGANQLSTTYYYSETYATFAASSKWSWMRDSSQLVDTTVYYVSYVGHSTTIALSY